MPQPGLEPGPSNPESSTLTTHASQLFYHRPFVYTRREKKQVLNLQKIKEIAR